MAISHSDAMATSSAPMASLVYDLIFINLMWGLVNLLPVYPLDGGQVSRELLVARSPAAGIVQSLKLSIGAAIAMAVVGLIWFGARHGLFIALMFGCLAYFSYQALASYQGRGYGGGPRFG